MSNTQIRLIIADDHKMMRHGLKAILKGAKNISIVGEAENGKEVLDLINTIEVDVVLIDINMPIMDGLEATSLLKKSHNHIKVIALSMLDNYTNIDKMLQAGANGYLLKTLGKDELTVAIEEVYKGNAYLQKEISEVIVSRYLTKNNEPKKSNAENIMLTEREIEILKYISNEFPTKKIADLLNISARTVDTHRRNMMIKLNIKKNIGLLKYAIQQCYI